MSPGKNTIAGLVILSLVVLSGCGGGGGSESGGGPSLPPKTLSWVPPNAYTDGTPLNPLSELDSFEIYVKESGPFTGSDSPMALVGAINPSTGQLVTTFNLANLAPYINLGVQYQVCLKAVAITGAKSDFSGAATFSF